MLSNALSEVVNQNIDEEATPRNVNFDLLFLAADEGVIELEEVSDILLANVGGLGREGGTYTQAQLERKMRDEQARLPRIEECGVPSEVTDYLLERRLDDLIDVSKLTALQEICLRLCVAGLKRKDLAATLGLTPARTALALRIARRKVRVAYDEGKYAGWYEVYLSEVNRTRKA
ncbi:MAG: hypothetical protein ACYC64_06280 [Armatimonadota bacterium]